MAGRGVSRRVSSAGLDPVEAGRAVAQVVRELGISPQVIHVWCRQDLVDKGLVAGLTGTEKACVPPKQAPAKSRGVQAERCAHGVEKAVSYSNPR